MLASLPLLTLAAASPVNDVATVLLKTGDVLSSNAGPFETFSIGRPEAGVGGGWYVTVRGSFDPAATFGTVDRIVGQRPGHFGSPPQILIEPSTIGGFDLTNIEVFSMRGGDFAYRASWTNAPAGTGIFVGDQLIVSAGDTVPGTTDEWAQLTWATETSSGSVIVQGQVVGGQGRIVVEYPSGRVLLRDGLMLPGVNMVDSTVQGFFPSPSGEHWIGTLAIERPSGVIRSAVLVDGELVRFEDGSQAITFQGLPASLDPFDNGLFWRSFLGFGIDDRGSYVFSGDNNGFQVTVRDGKGIDGLGELRDFLGMDERGFVMTKERNRAPVFVENVEVLPQVIGIDVDGDGVVDPGWRQANGVFGIGATRLMAGPAQQSLQIIFELIRDPSGELLFAILRGPDLKVDRLVCEGVPNSTGFGASIVATGNPDVSANDITLTSYGLPEGAPGYFILSQTPGNFVQLGGSVGTLCLGGNIGRVIDQVFVAGSDGRGNAMLDLTALPQPAGTVAAAPGDTWFAQAWHRDSSPTGAISNFSGAVAVTFD